MKPIVLTIALAMVVWMLYFTNKVVEINKVIITQYTGEENNESKK